MKSKKNKPDRDEMLPEYDFPDMTGGVRGKYVKRYRQGTNIVVLERDVAKAFPSDQAVNETLRAVMQAATRMSRRAG
ncbi:MAG: hypothetical protein EXR70_00045 [Deltaproteobacteria bacterium]|nr:hypothetical protein [Deltaproteobacteria bacterium]